jgi:hypothetical protein
MNRNSSKLRKKFNRRTKKKHTHRKNKNKNKANIILEQRFKNLNAKTVKALQNKFRKERLFLLHKNKHIVNREQIGCSNKQNSMSGGSIALNDVLQKIREIFSETVSKK